MLIAENKLDHRRNWYGVGEKYRPDITVQTFIMRRLLGNKAVDQ